jgi:urease accessory protein
MQGRAATITTTITMATRRRMCMSPEPGALARLLVFASPAFPTGGFAYSHGLEWAVHAGDVRDEAGFLAWLHVVLAQGAGRGDAILMRHAHRAADDSARLEALAELASALAPSPERQLESLAQGAAFSAAARIWGEAPDAAYPVAFGAFAARQAIGEDEACIGYLTVWVANLVSAGVRLVPLGQSAGLRVVRALEDLVARTAEESRFASLDDLGTACFRADIASMRHEAQYSRMFRS